MTHSDTDRLNLLPPERQAVLTALESYWRELRGARRLPVRTEVDPARIDAALPHAMILERVGAGIARLRVAGGTIVAHAGMEARGLPLSALFGCGSREQLAETLEQVFAGPALLDLPVSVTRGLWRGKMHGRLLVLPLLGRGGSVDRALAALVMQGDLPGGGRSIDIERDGAMRLLPIPAPLAVCEVAPRRLMVAAQGGAPRPMADGAPPRPALRLVVSNPR